MTDPASDSSAPDTAAPGTAAPDAPDLETPAHYPSEWEADVVLRDGSVAHVRPIRPEDAEGIREFHRNQSEESIYLRFFAPIKELSDKDVHRFTHVDHVNRVALVVTVRGEIIGIGRFDRLGDRSQAEVAFNISDHYQGKGIGSVLLEHLATIGQEIGVEQFVAEVLPQNRKMMKVFTDAGYAVEHHFDDGVIAVSFRIEPTDASVAVQLQREHRAEGQSIKAVLTPASVAVVGASRRPGAIGSIVLDNIMDHRFAGDIYIVNSEATRVRGIKAYAKLTDIGKPVDLVVIAVPRERVLDVVDDAAAAGATAVVVVSIGFAEADEEGEELQAQILARAREAGMRVVGPASFGLVNNHPDVRLGAVLAREVPPRGRLGVFTQSAGLGISVLAECARRRLGISTSASAGNRVDVSGNDLMQYWIDDDDTDAVALYFESIGNARKFSRIARQLALRKPVVLVKSPTSGHVPPGHRARRTTVPPAAFDALVEQSGVMPATNVRRMIDIAELVSHQPVPAGRRIAVVGNSDGLNAIIAATAEREGLVVTHGPVTLPLRMATPELYSAVAAAMEDPAVDALVTCFIPPTLAAEEEVASTLAHAVWNSDKTCVSSFLGMRDVGPTLRKAAQYRDGKRRVVPAYLSPTDAVSALAAVARYGAWRAADHGERVHPAGVRRGEAQAIVDEVLAQSPDGRELTLEESARLLATYGVDVWPARPAADADAAVRIAEDLGYPVVLKASEEAAHGLAGAVSAGLNDEAGVRGAFAAIAERFHVEHDGDILVQRQAPLGVATAISSTEDPVFGPVIAFGLSGPATELAQDVAYAVPPLTDVDIHDLLRRPRTASMLTGYRGAPVVDQEALADIVARLSQLADDHPELANVELDPVVAHEDGAVVLGVRVRVAHGGVRADAGRRALR